MDRVGSGPSLQELRKLAGRVAKFGPACNSARNRAKGVLRNMKLLYFFVIYLYLFIVFSNNECIGFGHVYKVLALVLVLRFVLLL